VLQILGTVGQASDEHLVSQREMANLVIRRDLIAAIRGIRDSLGEE
jgi:hypothetical protein